eukprot:7944554-Pyramimonas_sp.AAC.1
MGASVELPMGPRSAVLGGLDMPKWASGAHAGGPTGGFGGAPCEATKRCAGWVGHAKLGFRKHAGGPTGTFGRVPCGATKRCTGCAGRMRAVALGPSVGFPTAPI